MRLLLFTNVYPSTVHPTKGVFNRELVRALAREHAVRVVCPIAWTDRLGAARHGRGSAADSMPAVEGVTVDYPTFFHTPGLLRSRYETMLAASAGGTLRRAIAEHRPDAVVGYWAHPDGAVAVRAAKAAGVASAIMVGGSDVLLLTREPARRARIIEALKSADAVVAVGEDLRSSLIGLGLDPSRVHVVPRGVDPEKFHVGDRATARRRLGLASDGSRLLFVGRMVPVKGIDVLLEACRILDRDGVSFSLDLVGDGPLRADLESRARSISLSDRVRFCGAVAHDSLADWYRAADLTVLPSRSEGVPNVLRESLACGTPYVASRVGGIPGLASEPWARLVEPGDADGLAAALTRSLSAPPAAQAEPPAAWSWEESARGLVDVLDTRRPRDTVGSHPKLNLLPR